MNPLLLLQVAFRNLLASSINRVIGGIIFVGTLVVVVGGAVLESVDDGMSRSIIGSIAGHLQVLSSKSRDRLDLFGRSGSQMDLGALDDFAGFKRLLEEHPNVKTVVPMGLNSALIGSGNTVDLTLARLRGMYRQRQEKGASPELDAQLDSLKTHVRHMVSVLGEDITRRGEIIDEARTDPADTEAIARAGSDDFWAKFDADPFTSLEFLENRIAPQVSDADMVYIRYVGTDLDSFQKNFDRMHVVDGQPVPQGQRGMLLSRYFYEQNFKLKTARRLDIIKAARDNGQTLARSDNLRRMVKDNQTQTRELLFQLDPIKAKQATERLQRVLGSQEKDLEKLLVAFLDMDDASFDTRYAQFYSELAPLLELYRVRLGDELTITAYTRTGYVRSINVRVYGTFEFKGLEKSTVAGSFNLMDLMTFRDLYGFLTPDRKAELEQLKQASGVKQVDRAGAEEALFGGEGALVTEARQDAINEDQALQGVSGAHVRDELMRRIYTQEEIESGVVLNAAILLKDPRLMKQTMMELRNKANAANLPLRIISWQQASGQVGQFVQTAKMVLYGAVMIIFVVALVIINNAMMMATLQRVREIGTMRAIGAQKSFVRAMVMVETLLLGLVCGAAGALVGAGIVFVLGRVGIPATQETLYFFFSGPELHPRLSSGNLVAAFVIVLGVSALSTLYPALLATRVSPLQAMQMDE
ncbi:ABC transporter permease [Vitiosangium sp. GDMCC 1.1324]|uniref:ABC transporter permease n=1 Tax=Vitiosangium sp. (strain GDMCC 1.1324) TaxID=2138576 RepID=UPI000D3437F0|nr:FtsX-like permease family protein [Vitiosangium sp. GDMCC 1.1324]PTL78719.1 ABC transporter permease [Vitiosangium sp. GDMCC 1.1324]